MTSLRTSRVLLLVVIAACVRSSDDDGGRCIDDGDCGDLVCSRDGACLPAADVHAVRLRWTVSGQPPSPAACTGIAALEIELEVDDGGPGHRYGQVPCSLGLFSIDVIDRRYHAVRLVGRDAGGTEIVAGEAAITLDAAGDGDATIDLVATTPVTPAG